MKSVFSFLVVSFALSSAFAGNAAVGSWSSFAGTATQNGVAQNYAVRYEVLGYETVNGVEVQKIKQELQLEGQSATRVQEGATEVNVLMQDEAGLTAFISGSCAQAGGTLEPVTVSAGTFNSCKIVTNQNGIAQTVWLAPVPGGVAKFEASKDADSEKAELVSYKF